MPSPDFGVFVVCLENRAKTVACCRTSGWFKMNTQRQQTVLQTSINSFGQWTCNNHKRLITSYLQINKADNNDIRTGKYSLIGEC